MTLLLKNKYLLTGANGFLGREILRNNLLGPVIKLGRSGKTDITCDLESTSPVFTTPIRLVIHAAGKAHSVPRTKLEAAAFYRVNYQGTLNLLKGLDHLCEPPEQFIFISTVAVYGCDEGENIDENYPLKGETPYAKSKILAEEAIKDWCQKHKVNCIRLRLPLVAGTNPPGNLGKMVHAIGSGRYFKIKDNPARKSVVLAQDIASLIIRLKGKSGTFNLTDGRHPYFGEIEDAIAEGLSTTIKIGLSSGTVRWLARGGDLINKFNIHFPLTSLQVQKMTHSLTFSDQKAQEELGWNPKPVLEFLQQGLFMGK